MKKTTLKIASLLLGLLSSATLSAQHRPKLFGKTLASTNCATREVELLQQAQGKRPDDAEFEKWLAPKVAELKQKRLQSRNADQTVTIPVVVHIVHNGDPIGANENLSVGQIMSQITVLNQDYGRMSNTPGYNDNPVGADTEIRFCLAQQDPDGIPTTGIVRHLRDGTEWEMIDIEQQIKPQTQWDPSRYLNIWVVSQINFMGQPGIKGYAQMPIVDYPGIPNTGNLQNTDGVVICYGFFGSPTLYPQGTYFFGDVTGRTASHEIGHYFGLRHIWGDGNTCTFTDYCNDTPAASGPTQGNCPFGKDTCFNDNVPDMIQNYMDYSSESCMNIFTRDQKDRMWAVIQNSPLRSSLITSQACTVAAGSVKDGSLNILDINMAGCNVTPSPKFRLFNTGTETLSNAVITYSINGGAAQNFTWTGILSHGSSAEVSVSPLSLDYNSQYTLNAYLSSVNGSADQYSYNDNKNHVISTPKKADIDQVTITVGQDFFGSDISWTLKDELGSTVASGGPYQDFDFNYPFPLPVHTQNVAVTGNHCYTFTINDVYGDGICCTFASGFYSVTAPDGSVLTSGSAYKYTSTGSFAVDTAMGLVDNVFNSIKLYPNPANNILTISAPNAANMPESYDIYSSLGQLISSGNIISTNQNIDISAYAGGMYFIKLYKDNFSKTLQFSKN